MAEWTLSSVYNDSTFKNNYLSKTPFKNFVRLIGAVLGLSVNHWAGDGYFEDIAAYISSVMGFKYKLLEVFDTLPQYSHKLLLVTKSEGAIIVSESMLQEALTQARNSMVNLDSTIADSYLSTVKPDKVLDDFLLFEMLDTDGIAYLPDLSISSLTYFGAISGIYKLYIQSDSNYDTYINTEIASMTVDWNSPNCQINFSRQI